MKTFGHEHINSLRPPHRLRLLDVLSDSERRIVQESSRLARFQCRQRIYTPGSRADQLFIVKSGVVKLNTVAAQGRELILSVLHPGDVFGELAAVDPEPRDHIAEEYEDTQAYAVDSDALQPLMQGSPRIGCEMAKLLGRRMKAYRTRVEELLFKSAHARVAHTLVDLAEHHGVHDTDDVVIPLRLSQRAIANLVGLTRQTVNFILKDLRQRKLIENQCRSIRVRAPDTLLAQQ